MDFPVLVQVSPSLNIFDTLTYNYTGEPAFLKPGLRVVVPVGNRLTTGWITDTRSQYKGRVKDIIAVIRDDYAPGSGFLAFVNAISNLYFTSMGTLLDASLPPKKKSIGSLYFENKESGKIEKLNKYSFNELQQLSGGRAIQCFYGAKNRAAVFTEPVVREPEPSAAPGHRFLVSFQRESYYREIIADCFSRGRSVLITVPDNLTAAFLKERLEALEIGGDIDIYNSEVKPRDRDVLREEYALKGKTGVVVGGQSAVFLPIGNLGLIISDCAGSSIYKRSFFSPYNVNVLSRLRASHFNIPLVEGFSTYTIDVQARKNRSQVSIEDRRGQEEKACLPVDVRMIKSKTRGIPEAFPELLNTYFPGNKKILVVLNRKESVNFLFCDKCKKMRRCPSCGGYIDVDDRFNIKCRRCGREIESHTHCPECSEPLNLAEDISIASVKKLIKGRVVETGIMSLSSEGLKKEHVHSVLKRIHGSKIVIATPVIVNPFFNNLFDAVIYLRPESLFNLDEYDAAEKIFSMVSRFKEMVKSGGTVDIFSTFHFHYSLKLINDEQGFFEREMKYRAWFHLPPFFNVYHIEVKGRQLRELAAEMRGIYGKFKEPLKIKRAYLSTRQAVRGTYKGVLEAHALPEAIIESGLLRKRDISIRLVLI
jgi:primosomal protein N'